MGSDEGVERSNRHATASQGYGNCTKVVRRDIIEMNNCYRLRDRVNQVMQLSRSPRLGTETQLREGN